MVELLQCLSYLNDNVSARDSINDVSSIPNPRLHQKFPAETLLTALQKTILSDSPAQVAELADALG